MRRIANSLTALVLAGGALGAVPNFAAAENVMIVFDGSNSMWGQIDGTAKIEIARNVMDNLLGEWVDTREVGLMAYGHRRRGDCTDIETLVQPGGDTRAGILDRIGTITPTGRTPLTSAIEQAATTLSYTDEPATVVLISDGVESCDRDPCAVAQELERAGVGFTAHVVGFGLGDADAGALSCIAENTGGQYLSARNADELGQALSAVGTAVATAPEPEPEPEPEPTFDVTLTAPDSTLAGSAFEVTWTGMISGNDYVTIVPVGADDGTRENHFRVRDYDAKDLRAPSETGLYEVRYVLDEGHRTLATQPIEVTEPEVSLTAPDSALAGSAFEVTWTGTISGNDYVTIVPMGADDGTRENHFRVRDYDAKDLRAPSETGLYEVRYVLDEGHRTLATQPIEVKEPEVSVTAPDSALAGSSFEVTWTGTISGNDYVTIVPMGADDGTRENHFRVRDYDAKDLRAPSETGLYEVRYVLDEGHRTLATQPIEVTEPEVSVTAPAEIRAGSAIPVTWTGTVSGRDYITIVPMGTEDGTRETHFRVRGDSENSLAAPDQTGLYEIRYVLEEGHRTLETQPIEILAEDATLEQGASLDAPDSAAAGATIMVDWTVETESADQRITIAGADQPIFTWQTAARIENPSPLEITLPDAPGRYELRLLDLVEQEVLARKPIQVE
ncbi:MAG: VWA domain-containing protein [Paracoccaceae bacterium]